MRIESREVVGLCSFGAANSSSGPTPQAEAEAESAQAVGLRCLMILHAPQAWKGEISEVKEGVNGGGAGMTERSRRPGRNDEGRGGGCRRGEARRGEVGLIRLICRAGGCHVLWPDMAIVLPDWGAQEVCRL